MHGKDLFVNDGCNWQTVEAVGEGFPQLDVVPTLALIIKSVYAVDGGTFVVAAQDEKVFRILDLVCEKEADGFERLLATVDVVAQEEVIGLWRKSSVLEQSQKIVILPMDISTNLSFLSARDIMKI